MTTIEYIKDNCNTVGDLINLVEQWEDYTGEDLK